MPGVGRRPHRHLAAKTAARVADLVSREEIASYVKQERVVANSLLCFMFIKYYFLISRVVNISKLR